MPICSSRRKNMSELSPSIARNIIERVGSSGQPPEYGFQFFSSGLDPYLSAIDTEYLSSFIKDGGSVFKMIVGTYGGGKTHFLYCVRDIAWKHNFVVSYVSLKPEECPFHKLELVYKAIVLGVVPPVSPEELMSGYEQGIVSFLRIWYGQKLQEYRNKGMSQDSIREQLYSEAENIGGMESISFTKAIKSAFVALIEKREEDFSNICQWLCGEGYDRRTHSRYGILQKIDKTTAFTMLRSLGQWVRQIGYNGIVVLLDEAERVPSLSTKQKEIHLNNLREIINESGRTAFQGIMIFYAVPDENFLEGRGQVYEALKQRLATVFEELNPSGVKIELERVVTEPIPFLCDIGSKLSKVYEVGYNHAFEKASVQQMINSIAEDAYEQRFGDIGYKRLFVQKLVQGFNFLRIKGIVPSIKDLR